MRQENYLCAGQTLARSPSERLRPARMRHQPAAAHARRGGGCAPAGGDPLRRLDGRGWLRTRPNPRISGKRHRHAARGAGGACGGRTPAAAQLKRSF